jgi:hypothetical protein
MNIKLATVIALLAVCCSGCVHPIARGGSPAIDYDYDWRTEFGRAQTEPQTHLDYREVLAAPGAF